VQLAITSYTINNMMLRISLLLQTIALVTSLQSLAFVPKLSRQTTCTTALFAGRKGAMSRNKGFANTNNKKDKDDEPIDVTPVETTTTTNDNDATPTSQKNNNNNGRIYSLPALYDLAFGYRNFEQEVDFLLYAHLEHAGYPATSVLELAAGPARHSMESIRFEDGNILRATALDSSSDMVQYGTELANQELPPDLKESFSYLEGDMRNFNFEQQQQQQTTFDTAWILLGSLQHMTTNDDVLQCFQNIYRSLNEGGTLIIELPHPRETFSMVDCTRNDWNVPLEDDDGAAYGELAIVWGDEDDIFDPITQVRQFSVSMDIKSEVAVLGMEGLKSVKEIVPMRQFTAQEIKALATFSGFDVVAMFGALDEEVDINNDDAFRLVCVLHKQQQEQPSTEELEVE
jgi:SAM-dependent methyltransferase